MVLSLWDQEVKKAAGKSNEKGKKILTLRKFEIILFSRVSETIIKQSLSEVQVDDLMRYLLKVLWQRAWEVEPFSTPPVSYVQAELQGPRHSHKVGGTARNTMKSHVYSRTDPSLLDKIAALF